MFVDMAVAGPASRKLTVFTRILAALAPALLLCACAGFSVRHAEVYQSLAAGDPARALEALEARHHRGRDRALYALDKAMLLRLLGEYERSNEAFESAKRSMEALEAISVTENLTAITVNEATRSYVGQPYEQLLVYAYKALNYLELGDVDAARVEVLQADVKVREWAAGADLEGIEALAFMRYLSGVVFELGGEWSEALIAYRRAYEVLRHNGQAVPEFLQRDLLRLTGHAGLEDEHRRYREAFAVEDWPSVADLQEQAEVIFFYHQGLVTPMRQHTVHVYSPELSRNVVISTPYYPETAAYITAGRLSVGSREAQTQPLENIDRLARENLAARMPGITLRTLARVVAKKKIAHEAREEHALAGVIADIAGMATETADTRSWTSLPASIQVARLAVPPGEHRLKATGLGQAAARTVELAAGEKKVISVHGAAGY